MADQYLLWALPGWLCAACLIANQLLPDGAHEKAGGRIRLAACSVAALLLAVVSWQRTHEYISPAALFGATIQHQPESSLAWVEYARAMRNSADDEDRLRAGSAALEALTRADAYRILDQDRPSLARESALVIHRSGEEDRALRWLDAELGRLSPAAEPVGEIERAAFNLQTGRTEKAIDLLAPSFESVPKRVVVKLRGLCKSGRTLPHELERMVRIDLSGDDADHAFNRDMILRRLQILAAAHHESGDFDSAFDVAAFMVNTEPDFLPGRLELVRTYRALGVPINDLNLRP